MAEFINNIQSQFYVTFIYENRWSFFLDGLGMTLLLTLCSFIFGTLIGALLCVLKSSNKKRLIKFTDAVVSVFIQLPTMVLLMIFVYIIFGDTSLPVTLVVIFGLTIKSGCYLYDIFYSAVCVVDPGEKEAARTLGMTKLQTFANVTLPQTIKTVIPVYKNQFVSTLQETSVVGYLAVMDLTRASDIVSSRTFSALFALLSITIIYLIIGWTVGAVINSFANKKHLGGENV